MAAGGKIVPIHGKSQAGRQAGACCNGGNRDSGCMLNNSSAMLHAQQRQGQRLHASTAAAGTVGACFIGRQSRPPSHQRVLFL